MSNVFVKSCQHQYNCIKIHRTNRTTQPINFHQILNVYCASAIYQMRWRLMGRLNTERLKLLKKEKERYHHQNLLQVPHLQHNLVIINVFVYQLNRPILWSCHFQHQDIVLTRLLYFIRICSVRVIHEHHQYSISDQ